MKNKLKNTKAITLIALVITMIVLLIIAGITIAQLTQSGLFEKARLAKNKYENKSQKELEDMNAYGDIIEKLKEGTIDGDREGKTSTIINDFNIKAEVKGRSITVSIDGELSATEENAVKLYFIMNNGEILKYTETLPYTVSGLEKNTDYSIKVIAVDKNVNTRTSGNEVTVKTANYQTTTETNVNLVNVKTCTADSYATGSVETNIIDGSMTTGQYHNWYGGTKCLIEYNTICEISAMGVYTTNNWGYSFGNARVYYSEDDSLTLQSDLSKFKSVSFSTEAKRSLENTIIAKRVMLTKGTTEAVYEFQCFGIY